MPSLIVEQMCASLIARRVCFFVRRWKIVPELRAAYHTKPSLGFLDMMFQHNLDIMSCVRFVFPPRPSGTHNVISTSRLLLTAEAPNRRSSSLAAIHTSH